MILLRSPSPEGLARIADDLGTAPLTYDEVGATRPVATTDPSAALPDGYAHQRLSAVLGDGAATFDRAVEAIRGWQMHRGQGFTVLPDDPPIAVGTNVLSVIPMAVGVLVLAGCRIVWTVAERDRFGFGYGTLTTHPARGEEAFVVERSAAGRIEARVVAFSTPRHPLMRLGAPVARRQQARAMRGYLDALRAQVSAPERRRRTTSGGRRAIAPAR